MPGGDSYTYLLQLIGLPFSGLYRDRLRTESNTSKTSISVRELAFGAILGRDKYLRMNTFQPRGAMST